MEYLPYIGTVTIAHMLGLMSPGPDFLMTARNSLTYSRRTGMFTAVGLGFGVLIHISYSLAGLALIISKSILLFNFIKFLGAGYLIYIGVKSLLSKSGTIKLGTHEKKTDISPLHAVRIGFLTNVLNPKATLYFLSLFTFVISPETPAFIMGILTFIMVITTMFWFSLVATFFTQKKIHGALQRFQGGFNKLFGGLLLGLGIKIALTEK